jgi:hypothetical protein
MEFLIWISCFLGSEVVNMEIQKAGTTDTAFQKISHEVHIVPFHGFQVGFWCGGRNPLPAQKKKYFSKEK